MRKLSINKMVMLLTVVIMVVGALGTGAQLIGACDGGLPPVPPC